MSLADLRVLATALAMAVAMLLAGWVGWRRGVGAVILALLSIVWFTLDHEFEGAHLIPFGRHHSLVLADLVGVAGLVVAAGLLARRVVSGSTARRARVR